MNIHPNQNGQDIAGGGINTSDLLSSYKRADTVVAQIGDHGLADIENYIDPYECIMPGNMLR